MVGTPDARRTVSRKIKDHNDNINKLWNHRPSSSRSISRSIGSGKSSVPVSSDNFIKKDGDTVMGALGWNANTIIIATGTIDIAVDDTVQLNRPLPYVFLQPESGTADDLVTITGAKFMQQGLWVRGVNATVTITVKNSGNIRTIDGADFDIVGKNYVRFVFDIADNKWVQQTTGAAGAGSGGGAAATYLVANLAANQTSNLAANDHIEYDTKLDDGGIVLQTGAGQLDGIFELKAGKKYVAMAGASVVFTGAGPATGFLNFRWYDVTNTTYHGNTGELQATTNTNHDNPQYIATAIFAPSTDIEVEVRVVSSTQTPHLEQDDTFATIFELGGAAGVGGSVSLPIEPTVTDNSDTWTGTQTLNLATGDGHVYKWTVDQNLTFAATVTNIPVTGTQRTFELEFVHDGVGGTFTVTLPNNFMDERGNALASFTISSNRVILSVRVNDGTNFLVQRKNVRMSVVGATRQLDNLSSAVLNAGININSQTLSGMGDITYTATGFDIADTTNPVNALFVEEVRFQSGTIVANKPMITSVGGNSLDINHPTGSGINFSENGGTAAVIIDGGGLVTSNNVILQDVLSFNDTVTHSGVNGDIYREGIDLKAFSGGVERNLSDIAGEVTTWTADHDAAGFTLDNAGIIRSNAADTADTGFIRMGNAETIVWEASPAGVDVTLQVDTSNNFVFSGHLTPSGTRSLGQSGDRWNTVFVSFVDCATSALFSGDMFCGDTAADEINFAGSIHTSFIPTDDLTVNLGSGSKQWNNLFVSGINLTDGHSIATTGISLDFDTGAATDRYFFRFTATDTIELNNAEVDIGDKRLQMQELSAAPSGTANNAQIFCEDNGAGKTRLMVQFGSGAAQQIEIEP